MKKEVKVGDQVAFNYLTDAVWFDVLEIDGFTLTIREHGTDYKSQTIDKSVVVKIKSGEA